MHPFVFLGPALALIVGQASPSEPANAGGSADPSAEQREASPAPEPAQPSPAEQPSQGTARPERATRVPAADAKARTESERTQVARAALSFLDALLAGDAAQLAAASTERFSFDGDVRTGKEEIRRTWRALLAGRGAAQHPTLLDLELLTAADALSRLGPPPARLAPLASARGTWVAIANVSRRPVVLFVTREGGRWAVAGME